MPSSDNTASLVTRDGQAVLIPELRKQLEIPACPEDRTSSDECVDAKESNLLNEIVRVSFLFQAAQNPPAVKVSQRDFHAKQHACLAATWTPLGSIPPSLRIGVFALDAPVKAVVRYSNGSPKSPSGNGLTPPDARPDARGLGIKLVDIPGDSILKVENAQAGKANQDFVLINQPSFFLRSPKSYPSFLTMITKGQNFISILDPLELSVLKATNRVVPDVVEERFFSQVPYKLGDQYAKYGVRPCEPTTPAPISGDEAKDANFLRARIRSRLKSEAICLIFSVQVKAPGMLVEDAAAEWKADEAKFIDVAKLSVPAAQDIDDPERDAFCENVSFNPWNALPENRPAGAINRARLMVYSAISRKRRLENQVPIREPHANEQFFDILK